MENLGPDLATMIGESGIDEYKRLALLPSAGRQCTASVPPISELSYLIVVTIA